MSQMSERKPKVIVCCNRKLECGGFTNTCPICGTDYNWAGQQLAPREQWGEETGETASEIMRPYPPGREFED